jgi:hypothetical protein
MLPSAGVAVAEPLVLGECGDDVAGEVLDEPQ